MPELLVILAVALVVLGPQRLPELAHALGRIIGRFRAAAAEVRREVDRGISSTDTRPTHTDGPPHQGGAPTLPDAPERPAPQPPTPEKP
ncbi:MAG: twin-arginine translocase TatA/TatE family subunit [Nitrospirota bacterium]|nr:twin-arginine translocase TatA/TatE family subunit [Nitrospirota bacterium]